MRNPLTYSFKDIYRVALADDEFAAAEIKEALDNGKDRIQFTMPTLSSAAKYPKWVWKLAYILRSHSDVFWGDTIVILMDLDKS